MQRLYYETLCKIENDVKYELVLNRMKLAKINEFCRCENGNASLFTTVLFCEASAEIIFKYLRSDDLSALCCISVIFSKININYAEKSTLSEYDIYYFPYGKYSFSQNIIASSPLIDSFDLDLKSYTLSKWRKKLQKNVSKLEKYFYSDISRKVYLMESICAFLQSAKSEEETDGQEKETENEIKDWARKLGHSLIKSVTVTCGDEEYTSPMNQID